MGKKVLILSGSPRKNGNSDMLCDEFARGAAAAGHNVEKLRVAEKQIGFCRGCYACRGTGVCAIQDDMAAVLEKIVAADVLVLASPVYFYSVDAQLKAVLDRCIARLSELKNKEFYYIATAGDGTAGAADTTLACFRGFAECTDDAREMGALCALGVYEKGEIAGRPELNAAYELGKGVSLQ